MLKLKKIDRKEVELKKRLEFLDIYRKETLSLLWKEQYEFIWIQNRMADLWNEIWKIEDSLPLFSEESQILDKMQALLESNRKELLSL